jgi:hypothetical protein
MSDQIAFHYNGGPGITGVPARDITVAEFQAMRPDVRRKLKGLAAYEAVAAPEIRDPLRSLSNEAFDALAPHEKATRTREAKRLAEEAREAEQNAASGDGAPDSGQEGN